MVKESLARVSAPPRRHRKLSGLATTEQMAVRHPAAPATTTAQTAAARELRPATQRRGRDQNNSPNDFEDQSVCADRLSATCRRYRAFARARPGVPPIAEWFAEDVAR